MCFNYFALDNQRFFFFFLGGGGVHFIELNLATKVAFFVLFFVCGTVEGDV
jgi:hypothetical protein